MKIPTKGDRVWIGDRPNANGIIRTVLMDDETDDIPIPETIIVDFYGGDVDEFDADRFEDQWTDALGGYWHIKGA